METERRQPDTTMWRAVDVAAYLKVSEATIRARILDKTIPFHKVGRLVRFRRAEIDAWVESQRGRNRAGAA